MRGCEYHRYLTIGPSAIEADRSMDQLGLSCTTLLYLIITHLTLVSLANYTFERGLRHWSCFISDCNVTSILQPDADFSHRRQIPSGFLVMPQTAPLNFDMRVSCLSFRPVITSEIFFPTFYLAVGVRMISRFVMHFCIFEKICSALTFYDK